MLPDQSYKTKSFNLHGLEGISDKTIDMHLSLYEGYVKATNALQGRIADFLRDGQVDQEEFPAYSELTRRLGFEFNGMVLHEYYFENLTPKASGKPVLLFPFRDQRRKSITNRLSVQPCSDWISGAEC